MPPEESPLPRHGRRSRALALVILLEGIGLSVAGWWYAGAERGPEFAAERQHLLPWLILGAGLAFTLLSSVLLWALARGRARALGKAAAVATSLHQSEAQARRLALVASHTASSVMLTDADWKIEWVNDSFTRFFGYTAGEAIGKRPSELLHGPAHAARDAERYERGCDQGGE